MIGCELDISNYDTDQLGTFTGEIPRPLKPYETCILKAKTAAYVSGHSFSVASEGSFGPHPSNPFIPSGHEVMVFVDLENGWVISDHLVTEKTNYRTLFVSRETNLDAFLASALFPTHALTLQTEDRSQVIAKGIQSHEQLTSLMHTGFKKNDQLFLSTDMRAMMNPTRMESIGELAVKLATRITRICPDCHVPGFGFKSVSGSLPCGECGQSTKLYQFENWGCIQCDYLEENPRKDRLEEAEPMYCDYCNP